jgi:peroxiredoxin
LGQLQAINTELIELGYQIIAVSPDRPEKIRNVLDKTQYDYQLISDTKLSAALACGVAFELDGKMVEKLRGYGYDLEEASGETHHMLPVPTVFVLDTNGTIRYVYSNADYKVRIDPAELIDAARNALG